jgi:choline dehydrogenase-like flavoprotein
MLIDAHHVPAGTSLTADVCIIGAGAAGITIARELDRAGVSVLLLESGGFDFDDKTQALYQGKTVGLPIDPNVDVGLDAPRLRYFGGTTNHWSGYCRPLTELDFQSRAYVPRSGWPFSRDVLVPFYERAQDVCGLGPFQYDLASWRDQGHIGQPLLEDPSTPHTIVQITDAPRFGPVYKHEIVNADHVRLVVWANVTRLELSGDNASIQRVDVATLSGNKFTATAKVFVVATGGLEVPRLLLASNDRRPAGVGNEHDWVGRCFMEHVNIGVGVLLLAGDDAAIAPYVPAPVQVGTPEAPRKVTLQAVMLLAPELIESLAVRSCEITVEYPFAPDDPKLQKVFPGTAAGTQFVRELGIEPHVAAVARVLCEQEPNPASRVTLTRTTDALGMPRIQLDWRLTRDDRLSMLRTLRMVGREVGRRGVGRFRIDIDGFLTADPQAGDSVDYTVNTGSHHMGTARMHASPRQGVVDPDCRVHSVANLYVAGSAVFPTGGANTPTLTIVALALRLADHLALVVKP